MQLQQSKQKQQQTSQNNKAMNASSEPQNPFSPKSNETSSQDQDMRISLNQSTVNDKMELANRDVDMRILAIPHQTSSTGLDESKYKNNDADKYSKNTQSKKANDSNNSSRKSIDYSQYLKDANIDLNQSEFEDPMGMYEID